jgi:hypothetical protein
MYALWKSLPVLANSVEKHQILEERDQVQLSMKDKNFAREF